MRLINMTIRLRQLITTLSAYTGGFSMASPKLLIGLVSFLQLDNSIPSRLISPEQIKGEQLKVINGGPDQQVLMRQIYSGPGKSNIYQGILQSYKVGAKEIGSCRSHLMVPSMLTNLGSSVLPLLNWVLGTLTESLEECAMGIISSPILQKVCLTMEGMWLSYKASSESNTCSLYYTSLALE